MQKTNWLRLGLASMFVMAAGGSSLLTACGGDDDNNNPGSDASVDTDGGSSGNTDTDGSTDTDATTSSSSGDAGPPPPATAALFVAHGYNEIGAVKICFAASPVAMPEAGAAPQVLDPLPAAETGLLPGTGGILPRLGAPLAQLNILPYLVKVSSLQGENSVKACDELIGEGKPLVEGTDYFTLPGIEAGTLKDEHSYVLVATKAADATAEAPKVNRYLQELDTATEIAEDKVGIQFIHGSQYLQAPVAPFVFRANEADADADAELPGSEYLLDETGTATVASLAAATALKSVDPLAPVAQTGFGIRIPATNVNILHATESGVIPISNWAALSDPGNDQVEDGTSLYFQNGRAFTFIALGDPAAGQINPGTGDFRGPHLLVIPNKPVVVTPPAE